MTDRTRRMVVVAALVGLSCVIQTTLVWRATVPSLDAVRFVRTAEAIEREGLLPVLRALNEQPLFPVAVWLVRQGLEGVVGPWPSAGARSVQLAAAIPLVLAVVPVYFLAVILVGSRPAMAGTVLFCILPEVARLGADGLSDSLHLMFFGLAFWGVAKYLQGHGSSVTTRKFSFQGRPGVLIFAGLATAAALLTRVETILLPVTLVVLMVLFWLRIGISKTVAGQATNRPQDKLQTCPGKSAFNHSLILAAGCFVFGFALLFVPYLIAVGSLGPRAAVARVLGRHPPNDVPVAAGTVAAGTVVATDVAAAETTTTGEDVIVQDDRWQLPDGRPMSFALKEPSISLRRRGVLAAVGLFAEELADAFGYWVGVLVLVGFWRSQRTDARRVDRLVQVFFLLYCLAVFYHASEEGYLSARHLVPLVALGVGLAGHALTVRSSRSGPRTSRRSKAAIRPRLAWTLVGLVAVVCLAEQIRPLHAHRSPHRIAAEWLAARTDTSGAVLDTRGWTGLYSGHPTYGYADAQRAFCDPRLAYVVLEQRDLDYASDRSRTLKTLLARAGELATVFPETSSRDIGPRDVLVYRWNGGRFSLGIHEAITAPAPHGARGDQAAISSRMVGF